MTAASVAAVGLVPYTAPSPAFAQRVLHADIGECVPIESAVARLDCFDAAARAALPAAEANDGTRRPSPVPAVDGRLDSEAADAEADFGLDDSAPDDLPSAAPELLSEVAELREILPGRLEITLTNGQVWRQRHAERYRLRAGYPVRIYPSRFGQYYRLSSNEIRGFIQVERVR